MADLQRMDRTWLCSVLFMDIAKYSSQSVEQQMKWKARFNGYLADTIRDVPEGERVILDTGDGAAVCFLGAPEAAMFAALHLWQCFVRDEQEQQPGLRVRIGVNLGPVKLVKDLNGSLNAIGDGINAGQRIMSFAPENQILVSQSFYEVVSRLSDDYKALFKLKGVETDKHVREHTVYSLFPPGSEQLRAARAETSLQEEKTGQAPAAQEPPKKRSLVPIWTAAAIVIAVAAAGFWYMTSSRDAKLSTPAESPLTAPVAFQDVPAAPAKTPASTKTAQSAPQEAPQNASASTSPPAAATASANNDDDGALPAQSDDAKATPAAKAAYDQGMKLIDQDKPADAIPHFDEALRASPEYINAYLGRAQARRQLSQYEPSIDDCNRAMKIRPGEPRVYFCRGLSEAFQQKYEPAIRDYEEAIRRNPNFVAAYSMRGNARLNLQQYDLALEDFNQAIRLRPDNAQFYLRRAVAHENLKQYEKEIQDYDEVVRLQPDKPRGYTGRANAKKLAGDDRGAAADRRQARQLKGQ